MTNKKFSHFTEKGQVMMVDVSSKTENLRRARARALIKMQPETLKRIKNGDAGKGDAFSVARLAGIIGAKKTADLIPLCHPLGLDSVEIDITSDEEKGLVTIEAECVTTAKTGVEMEAMTAVSIAALTFYDMCKAIERAMTISSIELLMKEGGRSGSFNRQ